MIFLNILGALALLFSYLSAYIDPSTWWPPAFLGLAYPVLVVVNVFFICYWIIHYRWWFLLSLVMVASGYSFLRQTISFRFQNTVLPVKYPGKIRVMTYNVHFFRKFSDAPGAEVRSDMLRLIKETDPDVICFQEYFTRAKGNYDTRDSILKIMHSHSYYFHPSDSNRNEAYGIAIFSKFPILHTAWFPISTDPTSVNGAISADLQLKGRVVRLFSVQLQSIRFGPGDYEFIDRLKKEISPDMQSSRMIGHKLKWAFIKRGVQAKTMAAKIAESPYPVIVCGDFNDPPVSFAFQTVSKNLQNCFAEQGRGFARTYNGSFPNFQIDYILCSPLFGVLNYRIIKKELSDHFPVTSDLSYP